MELQPNLNLFFEWLRGANSLLKIGVFFLIWAIAWLPIAIPIAWRFNWHPTKPLRQALKLALLAPLYAIAPLIVWGAATIEKSSFADYGLTWQPKFFLSTVAGLSLGIGGLIVVFTVERSLGWLQWQTENLPRLRSVIFPLLALALWISITEELIFRGFLLDELQQSYKIAVAAIVSSTIFALLHLIWERAQTIPQLPGLWLMGTILVGARLVDDGSLGLACGLHAGWIWGLSSLDSAQLLFYTGKGSPWITGIGGQPIAGIAGILCLFGTGAILSVGFLKFFY
ncbi:MAG: CPBP family intramembrane metalloprotease [Hydrococcus sp. C42_A2020_068]|uniref:CPBP family intramembrane glutamic endopeptidase n=1 Tax=Pleurocapsa sp. PCC 7327 TaxID=118163 RepID=UPI00029FA189|nr:CPBP family intramembrane glutamic endopeptidase [Pleurocapsa sp. PCC 7327]AFY79619.1 CAAX amino terminal protease family [Pleurocapsa sp. PCC 7327]MBF2021194.1 CPBP family intramembrane metalloprotease [Hydrococcus sp. C42_A2020_068]